ncbi:DUF1800 family protein [Mucilaginibacter litoreus]|uniref:DUF1800 family protein n=1 Tax=Mucilaginibacter litoreus TaxID=1048221 RepID=A0ABW3AXF0_9SPHI
MSDISKIKHLYARAGFGLQVSHIKMAERQTLEEAIELIFKSSEVKQPLSLFKQNINYKQISKTDSLSKKMFLKQQRQKEKELNLAWINQMSSTNAILREKMTLFWHNHFACRTQNPWHAQQLNNIHRQYALGNFRTLLLQVSQSPAMLQFLNNQQNKKGHPNENFARELMELFTIGRGNYTEQDVKESARAFTGWGFNNNGNFIERGFLHDDGSKKFMGHAGSFKGIDIINMLLEKKETARFISAKLYRYLVNDTPDAVHVNEMADVLYNNNYEVAALLRYVFSADWFYAPANTGNLIKSPIDLLVGLNRQFDINYDNPDIMMQFQRALGQVLFYPPNVAGWPGGRNWIDSSSLMFRLKIPATILNNGIIDFRGKADPEDEAFLAVMPNQPNKVKEQALSRPHWDKLTGAIYKGLSNMDIAQTIIAPKLSSGLMSIIKQSADMKTMIIELVSTPEYQLC